MRGVVDPDREREHHPVAHHVVYFCHAAVGLERVVAAEERRLGGAICVAERAACQAGECGFRVLVHEAVLDPEAADLDEVAGGLAVRGDELGDDGELPAGVDGLAGSVETLVAQPVRVGVAAALVAEGRTTL